MAITTEPAKRVGNLTAAGTGNWEYKPCSFCQGAGKDPFGIMSWLSTCCVCGGRGLVAVAVPYRRCVHCEGSGAVKTFTCTVCRGTGYVPQIPGPTLLCPDCRGSGSDPGASGLACIKCRGRGVVPG